jgi:hypothetical protein
MRIQPRSILPILKNKFTALGWITLTVLSLSACNRNSPPPTSIVVHIGDKPFHFDPHQVVDLEIAKSDPETGDRWLTQLKGDHNLWKITAAPDNQPILDERADDIFIFHLLDTLQGLRIDAIAPHGSLESFGLEPPRFAVRWSTPQGSHEFRLGSALKDRTGNYFTLDGQSVFVVSGPAVKMLSLIESFQWLRKRSWATLNADNIDEIELSRKGKLLIYAQREGNRWTDRQHRELKQDINSFLINLTATQSDRLVDDATSADRLKKELTANFPYEAKLSDRRGRSTVLKIAKITAKSQSGVYGSNSARPQAVFALPPSVLQEFSDVTH